METTKKGLALDIDETLSHTLLYWTEILQKNFGNPENLSPRKLQAKYGYAQNVPYWQSKKAQEWMENARTSNSFHETLPLIDRSNEYVEKINQIIPIIVYITTRPEKVSIGTKNWLKKYNFPNVAVIHKPNNVPTQEGYKWKAKVLKKLYPQVIGIIDDHPNVVKNLPKSYKGVIFLYDNDKSPRKDLNIIPCKTWEDVLTKVKTFKLSDKK